MLRAAFTCRPYARARGTQSTEYVQHRSNVPEFTRFDDEDLELRLHFFALCTRRSFALEKAMRHPVTWRRRRRGPGARHTEKREMKTPKSVQSSEDLSHLSIPDAEEIIEGDIRDLGFSAASGTARALRFLAPPGYQAIVELCGENGRSKRRNASADAWSPEEDEVRIYFERVDGAEPASRGARASRGAVEPAYDDEDDSQEAVIPADIDARVKELCTALDRKS